jgi:hypothetical protein
MGFEMRTFDQVGANNKMTTSQLWVEGASAKGHDAICF